MKVRITSEYRFVRLPDRSVWTETAFPHSYWRRYLQNFDEVCIFARVKDVDVALPSWQRVDGSEVSVNALPDYVGPFGYLTRRREIREVMEAELRNPGAIILSVPSPIALIAEEIILRKKMIYGIEVMGDPWEVFSSTGISHPLRIYFRHSLTSQTKRQVLGASAVSYVTGKTLQKRYLSSPEAYAVGVSNIDLLPEHLAEAPRAAATLTPIRLISVGSLEQLYKGPDIVLSALAKCVQSGMKINLSWIGGGKFLPAIKRQADELGLRDLVHFHGQLSSGELVRNQLDQSDLFVLASRTEGLPRALIEAMARGLPCIGTSVGGIPELLEPDELFAPNSPSALEAKIREVVTYAERMQVMSQRNLLKSGRYLKKHLEQQRFSFLAHLNERTKIHEALFTKPDVF